MRSAVPELQTALAGWTNPPEASIVLSAGGFTDQVNSFGPWPSLGGGAGVVFFESRNDINGDVLAVGGATGSEDDGGTVNGTLFNRLRSGFVMFQNEDNLPDNSDNRRISRACSNTKSVTESGLVIHKTAFPTRPATSCIFSAASPRRRFRRRSDPTIWPG